MTSAIPSIVKEYINSFYLIRFSACLIIELILLQIDHQLDSYEAGKFKSTFKFFFVILPARAAGWWSAWEDFREARQEL